MPGRRPSAILAGRTRPQRPLTTELDLATDYAGMRASREKHEVSTLGSRQGKRPRFRQ